MENSKTLTGNVVLYLHNLSNKSHSVEVIDHGYKTNNHTVTLKPASKTALTLNLANSHNWYDLSVKITGAQNFEKHYAGRVETGRSGFSDPQMGNV